MRAGVSDDEWQLVIRLEIAQVKEAFAEFKITETLAASWNPKLTFLITVKGHDRRYATVDLGSNVSPETVVD